MGRLRLPVRARDVAIAFLVLPLLGLVFSAGPAQAATRPRVLTIAVTGVVDPFTAGYVQRGLDAARAENDPAVVVTLDTSGGLDSSMRKVVAAIEASRVPVVCYVPPGGRADSAGVFILLACPLNGMAPGTTVGAARPVGLTAAFVGAGGATSDADFIAGVATHWGRSAAAARAAVQSSAIASASTAVSDQLVDYVARSLGALLDDAGACATNGNGPGAFRTGATFPVCGVATAALSPTLGEGFFHAFTSPTLAFILLTIALVALVVWVLHPHVHAALATAVVGLALGLAVLATLPVRAAGLILLVVAAALLALDARAHTRGALAAGGTVVLVLGGLLLFNPDVPAARVSPWVLFSLPVVLGVACVLVVRAVGEARDEPLHAGPGALAGQVGVAETALEPKGRVRVKGESWSATSAAETIPAGATVRVVGISGLTLQVEADPTVTAS